VKDSQTSDNTECSKL